MEELIAVHLLGEDSGAAAYQIFGGQVDLALKGSHGRQGAKAALPLHLPLQGRINAGQPVLLIQPMLGVAVLLRCLPPVLLLVASLPQLKQYVLPPLNELLHLRIINIFSLQLDILDIVVVELAVDVVSLDELAHDGIACLDHLGVHLERPREPVLLGLEDAETVLQLVHVLHFEPFVFEQPHDRIRSIAALLELVTCPPTPDPLNLVPRFHYFVPRFHYFVPRFHYFVIGVETSGGARLMCMGVYCWCTGIDFIFFELAIDALQCIRIVREMVGYVPLDRLRVRGLEHLHQVVRHGLIYFIVIDSRSCQLHQRQY